MNTWQIERSEFKESQRLICKSALWLLAVSSDDELLEWTIHLHREGLQIRCPKDQKQKLNQKKQKVTFKHYQMLKTLAQTYPQTWDLMSDIEMLTENWLWQRHWHAIQREALERLWIRSFYNFNICIFVHLKIFC